jgi:hypothetical protein
LISKSKFVVDELYRKAEFAPKIVPIPESSITINNAKSGSNIYLNQEADLKQKEDHKIKETQSITKKRAQNSIDHIENLETSLKSGRSIIIDSSNEDSVNLLITPNRQIKITDTSSSEGLFKIVFLKKKNFFLDNSNKITFKYV